MIDSEEIKQMKGVQESEASWQRRKKFLIVFQSKFQKERLNTLSYCYVSVLLFGCRYSEKLMDELYEMACEVANYQWDDPVTMTKWDEIFEEQGGTGVKKLKKKKYKTNTTKCMISKHIKVNLEERSDEDSMMDDFCSTHEFPAINDKRTFLSSLQDPFEINKSELSFNDSTSQDYICPVFDMNINPEDEHSSADVEKQETHISKFRKVISVSTTESKQIMKKAGDSKKTSPKKEMNKTATRKLVCDTLLSVINQNDKISTSKSVSSKIQENQNVKKMYHAFKDTKTSEKWDDGESKTDKSVDKGESQTTDQKQENSSEKVKQNKKVSQKTRDKLCIKTLTHDKKAGNSHVKGKVVNSKRPQAKISQKSQGKEKKESIKPKLDPNSCNENKNLHNEDLKGKQKSGKTADCNSKTKPNNITINEPKSMVTKSQKPVEKVKSKVKDKQNQEKMGNKDVKSKLYCAGTGESKTKEKQSAFSESNIDSVPQTDINNNNKLRQEKTFSKVFVNKNMQDGVDKFNYRSGRSPSPLPFQENHWSGYSSRGYGYGARGTWDYWSFNNTESWYCYDSGYNWDPVGIHRRNRRWFPAEFTRENSENQFTTGSKHLSKIPVTSKNFPFYDFRSNSMPQYSGSKQRGGRSGYPVEISEDKTGNQCSGSKKLSSSSTDGNNNVKDVTRDSVESSSSPSMSPPGPDSELKGGKNHESKSSGKVHRNVLPNKAEGTRKVKEGEGSSSFKSTQRDKTTYYQKLAVDRSYKSIDHPHNVWLQSVLDQIQKT